MRLEWITSLRATRTFTPDDVSQDQMTAVLEAARWAGSARNRQPWRFAVVRDRALLRELSALGAYAGHLAGAPVAVLLAVDATLSTQDAEFDAGRAAQNLMLAAHMLGLGSCPVSFFPAGNAETATRLAGFREPWHVRTGISLGHPAPAAKGTPAIPQGRLPLGDLVIDLP
ncbi:nitroreductase [Spongiactinospora rosea]|uniref:Nitroreductase n=1 Tax=Spongiactinospora rosea TaxID=2248750 RepID=A0A366LS08_9ACTN|nr:nitroreductase [Spongiactinospora rosea]RBQ16755.1 nitroreductase [Spongiactinospora rosea]